MTILQRILITSLKGRPAWNHILDVYALIKFQRDLLAPKVVKQLLKAINQFTGEQVTTLEIKVIKLAYRQLGGGFLGSLGKMALGTAKGVAGSYVKKAEGMVKDRLDVAKFVYNNVECDKPKLIACLAKSGPKAAPLVAACAATGVATAGAGCLPAVTALGGTAAMCATQNCKPKLF